MRLAVFIERDGLLNQVSEDHHYGVRPVTPSEFRPRKEAVSLLRTIKDAGLLTIATTNQPWISRGELSRRELDFIHDRLRRVLPLDDILACPHDEADRCPCRKPKPGLLIEAQFKWHLDLERSFVISDKWQDAEAARIAGCTSILVTSPWNGPGHHDFIMPSFEEAVAKLLTLTTSAQGILSH